ncbi:MAG: diguanylate cyclase [Pseudomonadales bacterium]
MFQLTVWSIPSIAAATLALLALARARDVADMPGGNGIRFLFIAVFCWSAPQALDTLLTTESAKLLANQVAYVGITLTPVAWFNFAITYSQRVVKMSRRVLNTVCFLPAVTLILALTNPWHLLIWSDWSLVTSGGHVGLVTTHGPWFYVHAVYSYAIILIATSILSFSLIQFHQHAKAMLAAIAAPMIGMLANLFSLSPLNPSPWMDLTTLGFFAGVVVLHRGILQHGLLNRMPVERDQVVEQLRDPVLVITHRGTIVDANIAALQAWSDKELSLLDTSINELLDHFTLANLVERIDNPEVTIEESVYEVGSTPLDSKNPHSDIALVFRDVTERRRSEQRLRELTDELERMAHTDSLTNMFNRRYFMQRLNEEFERVRRHDSTLSVLIFDLDHFKNVNDTYGHDIGDAVLVAVSSVANRIKRVTDVACRLGGEEFALLLPETDKAGAIKMAHRLRQGIETYPYAELIKKPLQVTASVGAATITRTSREPENILKVADRALYDAKNGGRNMVCFNQG